MTHPEPLANASAPKVEPTEPTSVATDFKDVLRDGRFRLLLLGSFVSTVGDWLAFMALFSLTSFEWKMGVSGVSLLGIAYTLPLALLSPVAGVWVDRWELRRVLVSTAALRALMVLAMAVWPRFWATCLLLAAHQTVAGFFNPAQHSALARLVRREHLLVANALNTQGAQVTKILGPGIAGLLVAWLGPRGCFQFDAVMLMTAALLLTRLPRLPGVTRERAPFGREFRAGLRFLEHAVRLRAVILLLTLGLCALGGYIAVMPIFARDRLEAGPRVMGFIVSALGVGAALGAFAVTHAGKRWDKLWSICGGACIAALSLWIVSRAFHVGIALAASATLGWGAIFMLVPAYALLQEETPPALLGRVLSLAIAVLSLAQVLGMAVAGIAASRLAPHHLLAWAAFFLGCAALVFCVWSLRRRGPRPGAGRDTCGLPST